MLAENPLVAGLRRWLLFAGDPAVAMLIAVAVSLVTLGCGAASTAGKSSGFSNASLLDIGSVLLIVGAGGWLQPDSQGQRRRQPRCKTLTLRMHLSPLLLAWLIAAVVRIATGSATVAIITAAGLVAPLAAANPALSPELLVLAMGAGSLVLSHVNDGGFWLVQKYVRMTVPQTLRTWTVMETLISVVALAFIWLLAMALGPAV